MNREEIMAANDMLMAKREQVRKRQSAEAPMSQIAEPLQMPASLLARYRPQAAEQSIELNEPITRQTLSGKRDLWDSLDTSVHADLDRGKKLVHSWYRYGMAKGYSCLIGGNVGCGKSHLARAILEAMTPHKAIFVEETKFIKQLQDSYGNDATSELAIIQRMVEAELLIYDDLGAYQTRNLEWLENIYRMIFEQRLAHRKPVLFTSNLSFTSEDGGDFGLMESHIGRRNYDRLLRGIFTENGPYYANLFNVPSYQNQAFNQYLEGIKSQ